MKILKYGDGYPKTATCEHCKSELEYDIDDTKHFVSEYKVVDQNMIQGLKSTYIVCPVCKQSIYLVREKIYEYRAPCNLVTESEHKKRWWQI